MNRITRRFVFVLALLTITGFSADAAHYGPAHEFSWIDKYQREDGGLCCGTQDCVKVDAVLLQRNGAQVLVRINGVYVWLPAGSVHVSEDPQHAYLCPDCPREKLKEKCIRCVFVLPGNT